MTIRKELRHSPMKTIPAIFPTQVMFLAAAIVSLAGETAGTRGPQVSLSYSENRRSIMEYDDQHLIGPDATGSARLQSAFVELACSPATELEISLRAGAMAAFMSGFGGERAVRYAHEYDFGPAWGIGVRAGLPVLVRHGSPFLGFFDYSAGRPAEWTSVSQTNPLVFDSWIEQWQAGLLARQQWGRWTCFAGLRWSDLQVRYEHESVVFPGKAREGGFEALRHAGALAGASCRIGRSAHISAEATALDANGGEVCFRYAF